MQAAADPSHGLWQAGVLLFCSRCGAWSGGARLARLRAPCPGLAAPSTKARDVLGRLRRGLH
eukprot:6101249-Lingulodinium_polyedra.AAC.1